MNPTYVRMRANLEIAISRIKELLSARACEEYDDIDELAAVRAACDGHGHWKGAALFGYRSGGWAVLEDLSGHLGGTSGSEWRQVAMGGDLIFAGYNDAISYGELVVVEGGEVVREFLQDAEEPCPTIDKGTLPGEESQRIKDWIGVASFVDNDSLVGSERGRLLILK